MHSARSGETGKTVSSYRILVAHFFREFFDTGQLSPNAEGTGHLPQILALVAMPGAFFVLVFRPLGSFAWDLVTVRYLFVSYSFVVMAFVAVLKWESLFPDKRDYLILAPLPIRLHTLFLAKASALALYLGVFLIAVNICGILLWPGVDQRERTMAVFLAHVAAVLGAGAFGALLMTAIQGTLLNLLGGKLLRQATVVFQSILVAVLVLLFFLIPLLGMITRRFCESESVFLRWIPTYWFLGLYEQMLPATEHPQLLQAGEFAGFAVGTVVAVFLLAYLPGYKRLARRALEAPEPSPTGPGVFHQAFSRLVNNRLTESPVQRAVFHFISQTITRSGHHRMFLAAYTGFGLALALMNMGPGRLGGRLSLDFGSSGLPTVPLLLTFVLVSGLRAAFNMPSELRSNWLFRVSGCHSATETLQGMRRWIVFSAILPMFFILAAAEFLTQPWPFALFRVAFGFGLGLLLLEVVFFDFRKVPFTCSWFPGKVNFIGLVVLYVVGFTLYGKSMAGFQEFVLGIPELAGLMPAILAGVWVTLAHWREKHLAEEPGIDYEDTGDPVIRGLELSSG